MTAEEIREAIRGLGGFRSIFIPEFTFGDLRIDALLVDTRKRWVRGFEIKVRREDFLSDTKWQLYSEFCSSLSVACPKGLIRPEEIKKPFGLLWVGPTQNDYTPIAWVKRPQRFQQREALAWTWTYLRVIEAELPRLQLENDRLKGELRWAKESLDRECNRRKTAVD